MKLPHKLKPKKSLGQHFICNEELLIRIADIAELKGDDVVLEIGAGFGNLTKHLAMRAKRVFAVEIDKRLTELAQDGVKKNKKIELICADILKLDWTQFFGEAQKIVVVGNIPYYITSPIIERLIGHRNYIDRAVLLVQKQLAERIASNAGTKKYAAISVFCQTFSEVELAFVVSASEFNPKPKVDSRLIRLNLRKDPPFEIPSEKEFEWTVRTFFSQRRKTIFNALLRCGLSKERAEKILHSLNLKSNLRPENLPPAIFAKISMEINRTKSIEDKK